LSSSCIEEDYHLHIRNTLEYFKKCYSESSCFVKCPMLLFIRILCLMAMLVSLDSKDLKKISQNMTEEGPIVGPSFR
jgi:hypothetical protein